MRHRVYGTHLGRDKNQRTALFKSLVQALILEESIQTTQAKAKAIKGLVDKLITQAKSSNPQIIEQFIINKKASQKLISDLAPRFKQRNSGYTSLIKVGKRLGDGAMMVRMSLLTDRMSSGLDSKLPTENPLVGSKSMKKKKGKKQ